MKTGPSSSAIACGRESTRSLRTVPSLRRVGIARHRRSCMRRFVPVAALAAAALACADASPDPRTAPTAPSYSFTNGPADPGPVVLRSSDDTFFILFNTDRGTGLASLIRLPGAQADLIPCGGGAALTPADLQLVFHRNGVINQLMIGRQAGV